MRPADAFLHPPWLAHLELGYGRRDGQTVLARRRHEGPLRVQKPLYPEGPALCHGLVLHPPGGIAGGDRLRIDVAVDDAAQVLLTTPGAGKWYRSGGTPAHQDVSMKVGAGGTAEWLPQESILFDGAEATMALDVDLAADARFIGLDILCFGRRAAGEHFARGRMQLASDICIDGVPLWHERGRIDGGASSMASPIGLAGFTVCATVLAAGAEIPAATLAACRAATAPEPGALSGVSAMPQLFVGRYLGHSAEAARHWFVMLWQHLRPILIGREAAVPRIWAT